MEQIAAQHPHHMNTEQLLKQAKQEAADRYELQMADGKLLGYELAASIIKREQSAFRSGVQYAITHLQAQKGGRVWREVATAERYPDTNGVYAIRKENTQYLDISFWNDTKRGRRLWAKLSVTHWLEPAPPLAPENEAVGVLEAVYEGAEQWHSEYDSCRALLQELVDLKNIKDSEGKTTDYEARQPLAWAAAKEFLKKYQHL